MSYYSPMAERLIETAKTLIADRLEYEESHIDAGDAYAHLPSEGGFDYGNGEERLVEYCKEKNIDLSGIEIDRLAEDVIFWSYMTMGGDYDTEERFLVDSYQVGEIEIQVDASDIGVRFTPWIIDRLNKETDAYWRFNNESTAYAYILSESWWDCVCDSDTIRDLVEAMKQ